MGPAYLALAVELVMNHGASAEDWSTQFEIYGNYAWQLESNDLPKAVNMYRKSIAIARDHHLDQDPRCASAVVSISNNLAWVLWNRLGSEEAILHYGRAIDLLESYLTTDIIPRETVLAKLAHIGGNFNTLYLDTSRMRESEGLKTRLAEYGVILDSSPT